MMSMIMNHECHRRLASARHYAYDVIEMCAPLRRQRQVWGYRSRTLTLTLEITQLVAWLSTDQVITRP